MKKSISKSMLPSVVFFALWGSLECLYILLYYEEQLITLPVFFGIFLSAIVLYTLWGILVGMIAGVLSYLAVFFKIRILDEFTAFDFSLFLSLYSLANFYSLLRLNHYLVNNDFSGTEKFAPALLLILINTALIFLIYYLFKKAIGRVSIGRKIKLALSGSYLLALALVVIFGTNRIVSTAENSSPKNLTGKGNPNVVLITVDTLRADYLSCYGNTTVKTPNFDRLAEQGLLFSNAISPIPVTGPSHTSLMTSLLPRSHGVRINGIPYLEEKDTLAELLQRRGYNTAAFVSAYPLKSYNSGLQRGFDVYNDSFGFLDMHSSLLLVQFFSRLGLSYDVLEQRAEKTSKKVLGWLEHHHEEPFFLWIHYFDPHYPYDPPDAFRAMYQDHSAMAEAELQKALYMGEVTYSDANVGVIVNRLKELEVLDNTLLIILADHGEGLGEHDFYYDHSEFIYDELIRIPLIMRFPPLLPAGRIIDAQVEVVDIMPTVLSILDIDPGRELYGRNLLSLLDDHALDASPTRYALIETFMPEASTHRTAIRTNDWKLIVNQGNQSELYKLGEDPGESVDLSMQESRIYTDYSEKLQELLLAVPLRDNYGTRMDIDEEKLRKLKSLGYFQ